MHVTDSLQGAYRGGEVVGDYGNEIVVRLTNGKEVVEYRDEVLIYD